MYINCQETAGAMNLNSAKSCIIRMSVFLLLICALGFYLFDVLQSAFLYNMQINSVILISILFGVFLHERIL